MVSAEGLDRSTAVNKRARDLQGIKQTGTDVHISRGDWPKVTELAVRQKAALGFASKNHQERRVPVPASLV